MFSRNRVAG